jgi:intracellular septation protein A
MKEIVRRLASDFLSTIVFLAIYLGTGQILVAAAIAVGGALAQVLFARLKKRRLNVMTYASVALVVVLGGTTLLTHDQRFVLAKPSIAHFAIGVIMLKPGWMLRYLPESVSEAIPRHVTIAGYAWAGLMFLLGAGTVAFAVHGDLKLWAFYVSVVAVGAKLLAFGLQYAVFWLALRARLHALPSSRAGDSVG